jgi:two-component system, cell cycle sensor histidine kinase and response regulator CckA
MELNKYIETNINKLYQFWFGVGCLSGAFLFPLLSTMDYFASPENFKRFLFYRLAASALLIILFFINRIKINRLYQYTILTLGIIVSATAVELMILEFGGHKSSYFIGTLLLIICIFGLLPLNFYYSLFGIALVYAIYLLPILLFDNISDFRIFLTYNFFLVSFSTVILLRSHLTYKSLLNELNLQHQLDKEKNDLQQYSTQLEELVQERTKELSISEKWYRSIFDNATDGVIVLDKNGVIVNVNQKACEIHGFEKNALVGINVELLEAGTGKENHEKIMSRILNGETLIYETEHYRKDGSKVFLEISSKALDIGGELYIQSFYRDITDKKRIQEQLMQSQKMESVGSLAGGIAHNFNNILTAILGYSELLLEFSALDETSKQRVKNIESSARKAGVMVSKLLSFARREAHEVFPLNINDVINDSVKLFEGVLNKRIGLKVDLYSAIPTMEGDPNQLEQVIMNLMVNARDAMPEGGLIAVRTDVREIGNISVDMPSGITPGRYIELIVSDSGCGIPKGIINRIFDPFFTTKEKGKGTGLGLATVYGIVKDHKGYIAVQSEEGKGTSFTIYLPVTGKVIQRVTEPQHFVVDGNENILVADDDRDVLNFIRDILETHGYTVIPVNNALNAVDTFRNLSGKIHLVITDIVMPLMEGDELIRNLREIKPDVKIIVVSGYSNEAVQWEKIADAFIKKPFESIELLSAVRQILDTGIRRSPLY